MPSNSIKPAIIRNVQLAKLALSPFNVRRTPPTQDEANEMKASILATGVAQNLIVHSKREKGAETFLVAAGGRRLAALQALLAEERIADTFEVPVRVVSAKEAEEISLVENAQRVAMHPADEFEAFARLIENGSTIEQVATRFGTSPLNVERRMKLGKLHPDLLAIYRQGGMTLETCKALTLTSDHDRQMEAWNATENERRYNRDGLHHMVRRVLTADGIKSTSRVGKLVDPALYEAEGGTFERDLFAGDDDVAFTFENVALAEKLALAKLEEVAAPLREEWKWVEVGLELDTHRTGWSRLHEVAMDVPAELSDEESRVSARIQELEEFDDEDGWTEEMSEELDELYAKRADLIERIDENRGFTPEQKAASGVIVDAGHDGPMFAYGILNPSDITAIEDANRAARDAADAAARAEAERADEADRGTETASDDEDDSSGVAGGDKNHPDGSQNDEDGKVVATPAPAQAPPAPVILPGQPHGLARTAEAIENDEVGTGVKDAPIHTQALDLDLRQTRRQVVAAHLAGDFATAFDALLWQMASGIFRISYVTGRPLECNFRPERDAPGSAKLDDTAASALLAAHEEALTLDWLKLDPAEGFAALSALPDEDKQAIFAFCVSRMLVDHSTPVIEAMGARLAIDVAEFWRPTAETYWGRVKKDVALGAARECVGNQWAVDHQAQKKADLARSMERVFAQGQGVGIDDAGLACAKAWLPVGMAFSVEDETVATTEEQSTLADGDADDTTDEGAEIIQVPAFLRGAA